MQDWLVGIVGEDLAPIVSIVLAALFVIVLALIVITLLRRVMSGGMGMRSSPGPRVEVVDVTGVDQKRKLVLVRRDQVEHLILIGGQNDLLIESHIGRMPPPGRRAEPGFQAQPPARPQHPGEAPQRPRPPQVPVSHQDAQPPAPAIEARAPRVEPAAMPLAPRHAVNDARREVARAEPVFAAPAVDTPTVEDRLDEAPQRDDAAPAVEPQRSVRTAVPAESATDRRSTFASGEPRTDHTPEAVRPVPPRAVHPGPAPAMAVVPPRPLATPTLPMKRTNPVIAEPSDSIRSPESSAARPEFTRAEPSAPEAPSAIAVEPEQPSSPVPAVETPAEPRFADRRVDPPRMAPPPTPSGDRQPLSVRSFASTIQERPTAAPAVTPPVAAPPPAAARPTVVVPPVDSTPPSRDEDDDLAAMLSAEFAADDAVRCDRSASEPVSERADASTVAAFPDRRPEPQPDSREMSLEEEMERLLRDFSLHTADRR